MIYLIAIEARQVTKSYYNYVLHYTMYHIEGLYCMWCAATTVSNGIYTYGMEYIYIYIHTMNLTSNTINHVLFINDIQHIDIFY